MLCRPLIDKKKKSEKQYNSSSLLFGVELT